MSVYTATPEHEHWTSLGVLIAQLYATGQAVPEGLRVAFLAANARVSEIARAL